MNTIKWSFEKYKTNYSEEWEKSVEIVYWECDYKNKWYIIKFKKK